MRGPEAGDPPGPSFPEGLLNELGLRGRVYPPEGTFARLLLRPRHFDEVAVQRQVVADRVLRQTGKTDVDYRGFSKGSPDTPALGGWDLPASLCLLCGSMGSSL